MARFQVSLRCSLSLGDCRLIGPTTTTLVPFAAFFIGADGNGNVDLEERGKVNPVPADSTS